MKSRQQNKALIIFAILIIGVITLYLYLKIKKEKFYNDFDQARLECQQEIDASMIYAPKTGNHVENMDISVSFDDNNLSSSWFHTNLDRVTVDMDDSFDTLSMTERCNICYQIMNEIEPRLEKCFNNGRYYRLFKENSGSDSMRYRNIHLSVYHKTEYTFRTSSYEYTFPGYRSMTVSVRGTRVGEHYVFDYQDGVVTECTPRFGSTSNSSESTKTPAKQPKSSPTAKPSASMKKTDPYDVYSYDSAEDFADYKYDEFIDYDDYYEDEDEAYDAAVDYWYDHH